MVVDFWLVYDSLETLASFNGWALVGIEIVICLRDGARVGHQSFLEIGILYFFYWLMDQVKWLCISLVHYATGLEFGPQDRLDL